MLSIQPDNSRAILIGTSECPGDPVDLPPIPAVINNIRALHAALVNPEIVGIPENNIVEIVNESKASDLGRRIAKAAKDADDTLIVYYAGHGLLGSSAELLLATTETKDEDADYSALHIELVRKAIMASPAQTRILILDCCYSGRALNKLMGPESQVVKASIDISGTFAISASPANRAALAPEGEEYTTFTGALIRTLETGIDNGKNELAISDVYNDVRTALGRNPNIPEPQHISNLDGNLLFLFRNRNATVEVSQLKERISELSRSNEDLQRRLQAADALARQVRATTFTTPDGTPPRSLIGSAARQTARTIQGFGRMSLYAAVALVPPLTPPLLWVLLQIHPSEPRWKGIVAIAAAVEAFFLILSIAPHTKYVKVAPELLDTVSDLLGPLGPSKGMLRAAVLGSVLFVISIILIGVNIPAQ